MERFGAEVHLITIKKRQDTDYGGLHVHVVDLPQSIIHNLRKLYSILFTTSGPSNGDIPYLTMKLLSLFDRIRDSYGKLDVIQGHYFTASFALILYKYFILRKHSYSGAFSQ